MQSLRESDINENSTLYTFNTSVAALTDLLHSLKEHGTGARFTYTKGVQTVEPNRLPLNTSGGCHASQLAKYSRTG